MLADERIVRGWPIGAGFFERLDGRGVAAVADRHGQIAAEPAELGARHGTAFDEGAQMPIRETPQLDQSRCVESGPRLPRRIARVRCRLIVRTDLLTDV